MPEVSPLNCVAATFAEASIYMDAWVFLGIPNYSEENN